MGLIITISVALLFEIALPIALAIWAIKHFKINWLVILIGMMTFMVVQVIQIPILSWLSNLVESGNAVNLASSWRPVFDGLVIGLSAGLLTEVARWGSFKFIKQILKDNSHAVSLGIGYGLIETILLVGLPLAVSFVAMIIYKNADIYDLTYPEGLVTQVQALWQIPWYTPLIGAVERLASLITHITLSVMILQVFLQNNIKYLFYAIAWHTFLETIPIIMTGYEINVWFIDLLLIIFSLVNLVLLNKMGIIKFLKEIVPTKKDVVKQGVEND
ncbi:MAG: YhfC family intramembrane metalloprotease [Anaerolineaceae bacterium]|nr:YhfC family intramembrane metalloprotease [Anaerolineaceae bacterium]